MNVKIDTKEKFSVITPVEGEIAANMTEALQQILESFLKKDIPHLVLNMSEVSTLAAEAAAMIASEQQNFYENNASFVVCELNEEAEILLDKLELLEFMNTTPTESEAWDIVQMEEIERELMGDFDKEDS
ncbi:MAG TPA: STAS domain-containing protein [Ferruginibacter sp.]|nr:STAS domain-containing protein [Ferruginibacter sp.]